MNTDEALTRLERLGFERRDAENLADHFLDADRRGKHGHGTARIEWLETLPDLDPRARPALVSERPGFEHWEGRGPRGYRTLAAAWARRVPHPPGRPRAAPL